MAYNKYHRICLSPVSSMFTDSLVATDISRYDMSTKYSYPSHNTTNKILV